MNSPNLPRWTLDRSVRVLEATLCRGRSKAGAPAFERCGGGPAAVRGRARDGCIGESGEDGQRGDQIKGRQERNRRQGQDKIKGLIFFDPKSLTLLEL